MISKFASFFLLLTCFSVFGQPNNDPLIVFANDKEHMVYMTPSLGQLRFGDIGLAGQPVPTTPLANGVTLTVGLYAGSTPDVLNLYGTVSIAPVAGRFSAGTTVHLDEPPVPAGGIGYFQVRVWESSYASFELQMTDNGQHYSGTSSLFTCYLPEPAFLYPVSITSGLAPYNSTWSDGTFDLSAYSGAGALGAIEVSLVPEPASTSLVTATFLTFFLISKLKMSETRWPAS